MTTHNDIPANLTPGSWIFKTETDRHGLTTSRKVTFLGFDKAGYVEYAEGWVDYRASTVDNFTMNELVK